MKQSQNSANLSSMQIGRRKLFGSAAVGAAGVVGVSSLLAACGSTNAAGGSGQFPSHNQWNFVFINHVTTNTFFTPTQYGADDAAKALGCKYQWAGSENSVVSEMVNAFNNAIASKADGIAVAIIDNTAFNEPVANALAAGIPVVSYNADASVSSGNKRLAYIGQDLFASGQAVGRRILSLIPGGGDVVGFIATPGSGNIQPRIDGINDALKGTNINFSEVASGAQQTNELSAVDAYYIGHPNIKGMFAVDGGSTASIATVSQKYSLAAKGIRTGGYDLEPTTLNGIQAGVLDFTVDQQPYLQGFQPVVQLFLYKLSGGLAQPSETNTGLLFVTKSNVSGYLSSKTRFEGSSSTQQVVSH